MINLTFKTKINVNVSKLYNFHLDTNNLPLITPSDIDVNIVKLPKQMKQNEIVILDIKKFGLTNRWEVEIKELVENKLIKDYALKSPFKYFEHDHKFEYIDEQSSYLIDDIKIQLPLEPFSNIISNLIKKDISKMFTYRHSQTKKILEK